MTLPPVSDGAARERIAATDGVTADRAVRARARRGGPGAGRSAVNRVVRALLRSPLQVVLGGVCELRFAGRRTGRPVALPVQYARDGDRLVVHVGRPAGKTWWRNVVDAYPIEVRVDGVDRRGTARVVLSGEPDRDLLEAIYHRRQPRADMAEDPLVVIDLAPAVPSRPSARRGLIVRHPVAAFAVLAYLLAWLCWLPLLADRQDWVGWSVSPYLHLAGGLGPAAAAIIVTAAVAGRSGVVALLRRCVAWRGRLGWLALAALAPLALFAIAVVAAWSIEGERPPLDRFGASAEFTALPIALYWAANLLFYGYGEEIGWRGFLQPALQRRHTALTAAVLVSVVWAGWHLPLFGITPSYRAMPTIGFAGFYLSLLVGALVLAWLYHVSRGSILVVAVFHAVFDIATTTPTSTTLIPTLMGVAVTIAGLATIPYLARRR